MIVYRASSLGSCQKALVAERLGFKPLPPPADFEVYFQRGHDHEAQCAEQMRARGWLIADEQEFVMIDVDHGIRIEGHIDGQIYESGAAIASSGFRGRVWEAKAPGAWARYEHAYKTGEYDPLTARYAWQSSVYMVALGLEQMVSCWDGERVRSFVIEVPPYTREQIVERVLAVEAQVARGLPELCSQRDYPCPYAYLHEEEVRDFDDNLDALAVELLEVAARHKKDETREKVLRASLRALLGERTSVETTHAKLTVYESTRTRVDVDAAEAAGIDLTPYRVTSTSTGLKVTAKKEAE